jgi:hypothetical protein
MKPVIHRARLATILEMAERVEQAEADAVADRARSASDRVGPRRAGRPGWTVSLFWDRYREAEAATPPPRSLVAIGEHFRTLDGVRGMEGDGLGKLRRRAERGEMPE